MAHGQWPNGPALGGRGTTALLARGAHLGCRPTAELQAYYSESWFTVAGARLKARRLRQAGMPDLTNWRFITLTMATRRLTPHAAYELGKSRLRRFLARLRKALGHAFKWCWKLEFHEDGYAHWHLLVEYREPIPPEMLAELEVWWGLGRSNVRRVKQKEIDYVLKYVAKGPEDLPAWVWEHKGRIRAFQTSNGFFTNRRARPRQKIEPATCLVPLSLRVRHAWDERKALLFEGGKNGQRRVSVVKLPTTFNALFLKSVREALIWRQPLAAPGVVTISQLQIQELQYEHRKTRGLAAIPQSAAIA